MKASARPKRRDRELLDWLKPKIGAQPLSAVADEQVLEQLREDGLEAGWSWPTIDRMMGTVSAVLRKNLRDPPRVPMYRAASGEARWLRPAEFARLCQELPPHLALAAEFAVLTMLRMRSMLQLTWDRIDLKARRAWVPGQQMKTRRAHGLPLSREAVRVLRELKEFRADQEREHLARCERLGIKPTPGDTEHVFTYRRKPIDDCNTLAFQEAVERAGLAPLRWHDLRHTGASWAAQGDVPLEKLMALGGWRDIRSVLRYSHLATGHLAEAAAAVGRNVSRRNRR